jgi:2-polyprenyl-3-methyl-5-hydroxy-6-metoxy-1,4-benzoquinol methylase
MNNFSYKGDELDAFGLAHNWKKYWSQEISNYIQGKVVDIGSGIGTNAEILGFQSYTEWLSVEPDKKLCRIIQQKKKNQILPSHLKILNGTSEDINKLDYFNTALFIDVLEHIEFDRDELKKIRKYLVIGGNVVIVAPAHNFLYSEFDKKIGHFRRYNKKSMLQTIPEGYKIVQLRYLDSVGLLASFANRFFLRSGSPKANQILIWDKYMIRISKMLDKLFGYNIGKTLICVLEKI